MANPDWLNFGTEQASTGSITVNAPAGLAAGQLMILYVATDGFTPTLSTPNGFVLAQDPAGNVASVNQALGTCGMHVFWKRAVGGDAMPVIAAPSGGGTVQCCHINTYSNTRTGNPFHKIATATVGTATTTINPPGVTTTLAGCTVISLAASANNDSLFASWSSTGAASPAGSLDSGFNTSLGNACSWAGGRGGFAAAGGPRNCTANFGAATVQAQITFAIASLDEPPAGLISGTLDASRAAHAAGSTVSAALGGSLDASRAAHGASGTTPASAAIAGVLAQSIAAHAAFTGQGGTIAGTLAPSIAAHTAITTVAGAVAGQLAPSIAAHAATVGPVTGALDGTLAPSIAAHTASIVPPLRLGAVIPVRQKANGGVTGFPSSGALTTLAPIPAWASGQALTVDQGIRRTRGGNVYELVQGGTTGATGPSGTGTNLQDGGGAGGCLWNFIGADPGTVTTTTGSMIVAYAALGVWSAASAAPTDSFGNTFTQVDLQSYLPPFAASENGLWAAVGATGGANHTISKTYGAPSTTPDEDTVGGYEIKGATVIVGVSYTETAQPNASNVANSAVTVANAPGVVIFDCWLNGTVRAQGAQHRCVPSVLQAPPGVTAVVIPNAQALTCLSTNGYIQRCGIIMVPSGGTLGDPVPPGNYQIQISTDNSEGAAIRGWSAQASVGVFGPITGTLAASRAAHTATVVSTASGAIAGQLAPSSTAHAASVAVAGAVGAPLAASQAAHAGAAIAGASMVAPLAPSRAAHAAAVVAGAALTGTLAASSAAHVAAAAVAGGVSAQLAPTGAAHAAAAAIAGGVAGQCSASSAAHVGFIGALSVGQLVGQIGSTRAAHAAIVTTPAAAAIGGSLAQSAAAHAAIVADPPPPSSDPILAVQDAIYAWVVATSGLDADHVVWMPDGAAGPAPAGTYIALRLNGIDTVSRDWITSRRLGDGSIVRTIEGTRHPKLELTCYVGATDGAAAAKWILDRVLTQRVRPDVARALRVAGIGMGNREPITVIPGSRSKLYDPSARTAIPLVLTIADSFAGGEFVSAPVTIG